MSTYHFDGDQLIASAVHYLIEGKEVDAGQAHLYSEVENLRVEREDRIGPHLGIEIRLRGPRFS